MRIWPMHSRVSRMTNSSDFSIQSHWPRLDRLISRSHFPFPSAISTDRDSIVSFPICSATRSISFRDSIDLISHFPFQCNFHWPRLDSIINLISQSMMTQNQGDSHTNKFGLLVRSHCVSRGRSRNRNSGIRRKSAFLSSTRSHLLVRVRY